MAGPGFPRGNTRNKTRSRGEDPGFSVGGCANPLRGAQHTILPNFPKNCMKLKEFGPRGLHFRSANDLVPPLPLDPFFFNFMHSRERMVRIKGWSPHLWGKHPPTPAPVPSAKFWIRHWVQIYGAMFFCGALLIRQN